MTAVRTKLAILGAGSFVFSKRLLNDILSVPALSGCEIALMDLKPERLSYSLGYARRVIERNGFQSLVTGGQDMAAALDGAEFVFACFNTGGMTAFNRDYETAKRLGIDQCIGDSLGPTGIMKGMRSIPVFRSLLEKMDRLCPGALLLNYVNPMAIICMAVEKLSQVRCVGLCNGVEVTKDLVASYLGEDVRAIDFLFGGINHMAWLLSMSRDGADLYPAFKALMSRPEYFLNEKIRFEIMQSFGYFVTESSGHVSDLVPWFRKNPESLSLYCDGPGYSGSSGAYYKYGNFIKRRLSDVDFLQFEDGHLEERSDDYSSYILEAVTASKSFRFYGNVPNRGGLISNLPPDACVEVPVSASSAGIEPESIGGLPPQLAALAMTNITVQRLACEAGLSGDPELLSCALSLDPLTGAVLNLKQCRKLAAELLSANEEFLPQFRGKSLLPAVSLRKDYPVKPVQTKRFSAIDEIRSLERKIRKKGSSRNRV